MSLFASWIPEKEPPRTTTFLEEGDERYDNLCLNAWIPWIHSVSLNLMMTVKYLRNNLSLSNAILMSNEYFYQKYIRR